jgi:hypothetical protein
MFNQRPAFFLYSCFDVFGGTVTVHMYQFTIIFGTMTGNFAL